MNDEQQHFEEVAEVALYSSLSLEPFNLKFDSLIARMEGERGAGLGFLYRQFPRRFYGRSSL